MVAPATSPTTVQTTAPVATPGAPSAESSPQLRGGVAVGGLLGIRGCTQDSCGSGDYELRAGPVIRGAFELRFHRHIGVGGELGFGYHKLGASDGESGFNTSVNLAAMMFAYPLARTRWDPFVGLGFGFNQDRQRLEDDDGDRFQDWTNRGLLRASLGLDIFVTRTLTVGPRLDYHLQFAGKICTEASDIRKDCVSVSDIDGDFKSELPRWIVFGVQLKTRFGGGAR